MNFIKKYFSLSILIFSLLLLVYIFFRSEIYWGGIKRNYYLNYYIIVSILIFFSIITFFINLKIKEYLIISIISLIISIYLFEGYLTFKIYSPKKKLLKERILQRNFYEKQTGMKWDRRTRLEIYEDLKMINNEIVVSIAPSHYIYKKQSQSILPLSGISNSETISCNENGYYSIIQSDRYGFNNPDSEWDKKEIEYLLVGDSFTYGECVNRPNDIASVLRALSNKSVLNLGQSDNGPLIEYATLREYLDKNVKNVLWIYYERNDLRDIKKEKKSRILNKYLDDLNYKQNLKFKQNEMNKLGLNLIEEKKVEKNKENEKKRKIYKDNLIKFIKIYNTRVSIFTSSKPSSSLVPEFKKIIKLAKELVEKNNSKLYFVYLPERGRYETNYDNTNYNLIKDVVSELRIPFIDIHNEIFKKEQNPLKLFPFVKHGHYNVDGYKKIAETIHEFTKN